MATPSSQIAGVDLDSYWMPFTGNRQFKTEPRIIVGADGWHYRSADGRKILDGLSGLWCCGAGHNRAELAQAIAAQAQELDYAPAFQFGHPKAFQLAQKLRDLTPSGLEHVFFTNSGSESTDTSLKIARGYWRQKGQPGKTRLEQGMLSIYVDPQKLQSGDAFTEEIGRYIDFVKTSRPSTPDGKVLIPGDIEEQTRAVRRKGLELDEATWQQLTAAAQACDVPQGLIEAAVMPNSG